MDITGIIQVIFYVLITIATFYIIPILNNKYGESTVKTAYEIITILVKSAEQIYNKAGLGSAKKKYVEDMFKKYNIKLDVQQVNALIESAVLELNNSIKGSDVND